MKQTLKRGYISISMIIIATILIAIGLVGVTVMSSNGEVLMNHAINALEDLGLFGDSAMVYDENGYEESLNVSLADVNPASNFTVVYSAEHAGWMITAYSNLADKTLVVPSKTAGGDTIVAIDSSVFFGLNLVSVTLPNTIKYIGNSAFEQNLLTSLIVPDSVKEIGALAFNDNNLSSLTLSSTVEIVGAGAFNNNQLPESQAYVYASGTSRQKLVSYGGQATSIVIPNNTKIIGANVFQGLNVSAVTFPSGLLEIQMDAFASTQLTSLVVPSTVTKLGLRAFGSTPLTTVRFMGSMPADIAGDVFTNNPGLGNNRIMVPDLDLSDYQTNADYFGLTAPVFCAASNPSCAVNP